MTPPQPVSTLLIQNAYSQRSETTGGGGEQYYVPRNKALQASAKEKCGRGEQGLTIPGWPQTLDPPASTS